MLQWQWYKHQDVFPGQDCNPVTVLWCINLTLLQRKLCSVHMPVFEIVVHQLDTILSMMYSGADNSSIDCRGTLAIYSYSQLHDLLRFGQYIWICQQMLSCKWTRLVVDEPRIPEWINVQICYWTKSAP